MNDAEGVIRQRNLIKYIESDTAEPEDDTGNGQAVMAMPQDWLTSFGSDYYSHAPLLGTEDSSAEGIPSPHTAVSGATSEAELEQGIASIIATMKGSEEHE